LEANPYDGEGTYRPDSERLHYDHAARIAFLVKNPTDDPITVGVNDILGGSIVIYDGCHRIAAAVFDQRPDIMVSYDGYCEGFENWINQDDE
jgi:hypothetical protein